MARSKLHKITIKPRKGCGGALTGGTTVLRIDGKRMKGVTAFSFEVTAGGMAKATIEMIGKYEISGLCPVVVKE